MIFNKKTNDGLKRVVGVLGLALSMVSITIGAGIFVLPAIEGMDKNSHCKGTHLKKQGDLDQENNFQGKMNCYK